MQIKNYSSSQGVLSAAGAASVEVKTGAGFVAIIVDEDLSKSSEAGAVSAYQVLKVVGGVNVSEMLEVGLKVGAGFSAMTDGSSLSSALEDVATLYAAGLWTVDEVFTMVCKVVGGVVGAVKVVWAGVAVVEVDVVATLAAAAFDPALAPGPETDLVMSPFSM